MKEDKIWPFFILTCLGLQYLHTRKILHRDIKTMNLFLTKKNELKIGDLGVAKTLKNQNFARTIVGTPYYLSPELCEEKPYNHKSDVWSLGCVLYEMCTAKHPFNAANQGSLFMKIARGKYAPVSTSFSSEIRQIIVKMLVTDTSKRPSIHEILSLDSVQKKAKKYNIDIPSIAQVQEEIEIKKTEFMSTFQKKREERKVSSQPAKAKVSKFKPVTQV